MVATIIAQDHGRTPEQLGGEAEQRQPSQGRERSEQKGPSPLAARERQNV
jgi:hypothetical protein